MKLIDCVRGKVGCVISCNSKTNPTNIEILEVDILGHYSDCVYVKHKTEGDFCVAPSDLFYNRKDAKKSLLRFLSKMHQKFMLEIK